MELTQFDRSNYLKGLLILVGKDKVVSKNERNNFIKLSKVLGFDQEFSEDAIDELLENEYISQEPPKFSNKEIAEAFVLDGIRLAFSDNEMKPVVLDWIESVADKNNLDKSKGWNLFTHFEQLQSESENNLTFEIERIIS